MWCFRSKRMKIIEWRPPDDRERIVYRKGKTVAVDQSYVMKRRRKRKKKQENESETSDGVNELKEKLVMQR
jgi:hypothetical protein